MAINEKDIWKKAADLLAQKAAEAKPVPDESEPIPDDPDDPIPVDEDILEKNREEPGEWREAGVDYEIDGVDAEPWDDQVFKKVRERKYDGPPRFQRYQFRLFPTGSRNSLGNKGRSPDVDFGNQLLSLRQNGTVPEPSDASGPAPQKTSVSDHIPELIQSLRQEGAASAFDAMRGGLSTGVPSSKFDYTQIPREPTERTAWVFDDARFQDFIARRIQDDAIAEFEKNPNIESKQLVKMFASALKAFFNLYIFFKIGISDAGFMDVTDMELRNPRGFWTSVGSRKMHRCRLLAEGLERYGTPKNPKDVPDANPERTARLWPIFKKIVRRI